MQLRRVVTEIRADGTAGFTEETLDPPIRVGPMDFHILWGTEPNDSSLGKDNPPAVVDPYWPGHGGSRFMFVRWAPHSDCFEDPEDPEDLFARVDPVLPGFLGNFEADDLASHASNTIDYGLCLEGELWMTLDEGREVHLMPGTCVIQRGTVHAWANRSDLPALMMFVLVGSDRRD